MKPFIVEKRWITQAGLAALAIHGSHRCGYVGVRKSHPLFNSDYDRLDIECHGGLTFSGYPKLADEKDLWWFGFDCAHEGDRVDYGYACDVTDGVERSLDYVVNECESIARQLKELS